MSCQVTQAVTQALSYVTLRIFLQERLTRKSKGDQCIWLILRLERNQD